MLCDENCVLSYEFVSCFYFLLSSFSTYRVIIIICPSYLPGTVIPYKSLDTVTQPHILNFLSGHDNNNMMLFTRTIDED